MKRPIKRSLVIITGLYLLLGLMLILTDPGKVPLALLIVPFIILAAALFLSVSLLFRIFWPKMARSRRVFVAACISGLPTFLLILNSVNQLTWRDVLLIVVLLAVSLFYGSRLRGLKQ